MGYKQLEPFYGGKNDFKHRWIDREEQEKDSDLAPVTNCKNEERRLNWGEIADLSLNT